MDEQGSFAARLLDSGLRGLAAATAVRQRQTLHQSGRKVPAHAFEDMIADTESRILHLCEALATGRPALFVEQVEWSRSAYAVRGVPEENLALNLTCLRDELLLGLPKAVHSQVLAVVDAAARVFERPARELASVLEGDAPHVELIRRLLLAILEARRDDALDMVLAAVDAGLSVSEIETQVIAPLQTEVGRLWQRGDIQVHEEHLGSQIALDALVLLGRKLGRRDPNGRTVLVCSVVGNLHDIGSRIVADHFELDGWKTLRLGANLPAEDIGRAMIDFEADLIALSVTMTAQVRNTAAVIESLRRVSNGVARPVLVGGPPFIEVPDLWQAVGADGWAPTATEAVREGRRLLSLP
jgi:methanogenic corrinoid protein MtbC1